MCHLESENLGFNLNITCYNLNLTWRLFLMVSRGFIYKWQIDIQGYNYNVRPITIKHLEEKWVLNYLTSVLVISFWICLLEQGKLKKKQKIGLPQNKKLLHSKENHQQNKRQLTEWENIFPNDIPNKSLMSKYITNS